MTIDMRTARQAAHGLSALCAAFGIAFVTIYLQRRWPDGQLLLGAAVAATASVAAIVGSVALTMVESWRRRPPADPHTTSVLRSDRGQPNRNASLHWQTRQAALAKRLDIDEPRLCTQAQAPCTCWSLCGGESPGHFAIVPPADASSCAGPILMPVVHRHGRVGCHLTPPGHERIAPRPQLVIH